MVGEQGYKRTELGILPEEWEVKCLGDICSKITDGTHDTPKPTASGVPFLTAIHIKDNFIDFANCLYLPQVIHDHIYKRCNPQKNDVLMVNIGAGVATTSLVQVDYEFSLKNVALLKPDMRIVQGCFLNYCLNYRKNDITSTLLNGGAQPFLSLKQIGGIRVMVPPLPEQCAIAAALSDMDALLASLDALIAKKRLIQQGAMHELLMGRRRLPGFSEKWEVKKIGDITSCTAGGTPSTNVSSYWGGTIRWMSSGELHGKYIYDVVGRITEEGLKNSSTKIIPEKCVLVGLAGQGKTRGTVAINYVELSTNQSIAAIFPSIAFIPEYLLYNLEYRYEELRGLSSGDGGRGGLNLRLLSSLQVPLPTIEEQQAIVTVLSDINADIRALEQQSDKNRLIKQGMMQELLTGKTRLI